MNFMYSWSFSFSQQKKQFKVLEAIWYIFDEISSSAFSINTVYSWDQTVLKQTKWLIQSAALLYILSPSAINYLSITIGLLGIHYFAYSVSQKIDNQWKVTKHWSSVYTSDVLELYLSIYISCYFIQYMYMQIAVFTPM